MKYPVNKFQMSDKAQKVLAYTLKKEKKKKEKKGFCTKEIYPCNIVQRVVNYFYRPRSEGDNVLGCVRPSVRPSVTTLTPEPFDLRP